MERHRPSLHHSARADGFKRQSCQVKVTRVLGGKDKRTETSITKRAKGARSEPVAEGVIVNNGVVESYREDLIENQRLIEFNRSRYINMAALYLIDPYAKLQASILDVRLLLAYQQCFHVLG